MSNPWDFEKYRLPYNLPPMPTPQERAIENLRDTVNRHGVELNALKNTINAINQIAQAMQSLARALTPPTGDPMAKAAAKKSARKALPPTRAAKPVAKAAKSKPAAKKKRA